MWGSIATCWGGGGVHIAACWVFYMWGGLGSRNVLRRYNVLIRVEWYCAKELLKGVLCVYIRAALPLYLEVSIATFDLWKL